MNAVILTADQTIIKRKRLAELERIERAHGVYLRAMRRMRSLAWQENTRLIPYDDLGGHARREGYVVAIREFAELVTEEDRRPIDDDELMDYVAEEHRRVALASDPEGLMEDAAIYARQQAEDRRDD